MDDQRTERGEDQPDGSEAAKLREDAAEQLSQADEVEIRRQLQLNLEQSEAGIEG